MQSDLQPQRGDVVCFTYENYSRNSPTNPKVVRIRKDISWKEVLSDAAASTPKSQLLGGWFLYFLSNYIGNIFYGIYFLIDKSKKAVGEKIKPMGYWKADKKKNMRLFFENIAKERGVDPLVPESWYSVTQAYVKSFKVC